MAMWIDPGELTPEYVEAWVTWGARTVADGEPALWIALGSAAAFWLLVLAATTTVIRRAGYSGLWILVAVLPVLNLVAFFFFAFVRWPVQTALDDAYDEIDELKERSKTQSVDGLYVTDAFFSVPTAAPAGSY